MQSSELLAAVALSLVKHGSLEDRINHVLRIIGSHLNLSRTYVFLDRPGNTVTDNTNEWCSDGIAPQHDELQGFEYSIVPSWRKMLEQDGHIIARDVGMLPVDVATVLQAQGIVSILVIPLYIENRIAGFMGFDQCGTSRGWDVEELPILQAVSGFLSTVLERDYEKKHLSESEANFKRLFDTIDDLIVVANPSGSIVYANAAVSRVLGYSPEELVGMPILEMHPEDRREEAARIIQEMIRRERDTCPLELARKDKSRVSVETRVWFGQWNGQECMYGVSKDLSEHEAQLQMFARLFNENPMPMAISNTGDRCFTDVNTAFLEKLGFSRTEVIGHTSLELDIFPNRTQREYLGRKLEQEGRIVNAEAEVRRKDGRKLHGLFSGGIIDNQGTRQNLTVMMDISEQIHLRDRLDAQRRRLRNIIDSTRLGTWEWDIQSGQTTFNSRWASMLGYTLAELEPTSIETWRNLIVPEDLESSNTLLSSHFSGEAEYYEFEGRMRHKDGRIVWVLDRGKVIERDKDGAPVLMFGTHQDITESKLMEEKIRELSIRDPLTGVYNRRYVFDRLENLILEHTRHGKAFCVSMMDLDFFKDINDQYGHQAGDEVLRRFTGLVSSLKRQYDVLGRVGGEEFLLVSIDANAGQIQDSMQRIMSELKHRAIEYDGENIRYTFSCGIADSAEFAANSMNVEALLALADRRLYEAKASGRERCIGPA